MKLFWAVVSCFFWSISWAQVCNAPPSLPAAAPGYLPIYNDANMSVVDADRDAAFRASTDKVMKAFTTIARMASPSSLRPDANNPSCALTWLEAWADQNAFTTVQAGCYDRSPECMQSYFELKWGLFQYAHIYLQVKDLATAEQQVKLERWIAKAADQVSKGGARPGNQFYVVNNHEYWVGASLMAAAAATGDYKYLKQAKRLYDIGIINIRSDGLLDAELGRKGKALLYHSFSAAALIAMAEMSHMFGEDWYQEKNGAIKRLVTATLTAMADPVTFGNTVGTPQAALTHPGLDNAWLSYASAHYGDDIIPVELRSRDISHSSRHYPYDVAAIINSGLYTKRVKQTAKAGWLD